MSDTQDKTRVISFRATADLLRLIDRARADIDVSRSDWVRGIITAHLYQADMSAIDLVLDAVDRLPAHLEGLHKAIWSALYVSLLHTTEIDEDRIKELIRSCSGQKEL